MKPAFPIENIHLSRAASDNLDRQLYRHLRDLVEQQVLPSGSALPSTRLLAKDLGIGRNTVIAAYEQLALEGYISLTRGTPPVVRELPAFLPDSGSSDFSAQEHLSERGRILGSMPYHHGHPGITAFHPGLPDASNFPFNTWSRLLTRRTKRARGDLFGSYYISGYPQLKDAIARYLAASRGVLCRPEQVVIMNGAQAAFDILARLLTDEGDPVWMEEPGYYGAAGTLVSAGARLMPLRVDETGWNLSAPPERPRAIFVTPSCHYPLGVTMPMEQRLNLVRMAHEWNTWIVEDDYDSEYRFQGQPIPALHGIASNSRVIFVGTFAKILFPAMRLAYMVVPMELKESVLSAISTTGQFAPLVTQAALADFIAEGHLTRHLRRMRRVYAERRQFFMEQFDRRLSRWMELQRTDSGIQLIGTFRQKADDRMLAAEAARHGVNVSPLSLQYRHSPARSGFLMGFAAADLRTTDKAIRRLASIMSDRMG